MKRSGHKSLENVLRHINISCARFISGIPVINREHCLDCRIPNLCTKLNLQAEVLKLCILYQITIT